MGQSNKTTTKIQTQRIDTFRKRTCAVLVNNNYWSQLVNIQRGLVIWEGKTYYEYDWANVLFRNDVPEQYQAKLKLLDHYGNSIDVPNDKICPIPAKEYAQLKSTSGEVKFPSAPVGSFTPRTKIPKLEKKIDFRDHYYEHLIPSCPVILAPSSYLGSAFVIPVLLWDPLTNGYYQAQMHIDIQYIGLLGSKMMEADLKEIGSKFSTNITDKLLLVKKFYVEDAWKSVPALLIPLSEICLFDKSADESKFINDIRTGEPQFSILNALSPVSATSQTTGMVDKPLYRGVK